MATLPRPTSHPVAIAELVAPLPAAVIHGDAGIEVTGVELDSRQVQAGDLFAALPGHAVHGAQFAAGAIQRGARALLTDSVGWAELQRTVDTAVTPVIVIEHPRSILGGVSRLAYGDPTSALLMLGITGTNGKTTVAYMLEAGLRSAQRRSGLIGTIGIHVGDEMVASTRTTPESPHLHALLAVMHEAGVQAVAMEVSSHALCEGRVDGLVFDVVGFTNLTQDHLDYHGTMDEYFAAKASLFTPARSRLGVVGIDDEWGRRLAIQAQVPVQTWSTQTDQADWWLQGDGDRWIVVGPQGERQVLEIALPGDYNRANALCAYAMLRCAGVESAAAAAGIAGVAVPGRMERVAIAGGITGIVDYAHSPDAIARAIAGVRPATTGRIIAVLGAGGDRDRTKRPLMGEAAARAADVVIITDDNPRSEDPAQIRDAVLRGAVSAAPADSVWLVPDRRSAIREAVAIAAPGDVVLLLGKGHEQGQEVEGVMHPFDDRVELRRALTSTLEPDA